MQDIEIFRELVLQNFKKSCCFQIRNIGELDHPTR